MPSIVTSVLVTDLLDETLDAFLKIDRFLDRIIDLADLQFRYIPSRDIAGIPLDSLSIFHTIPFYSHERLSLLRYNSDVVLVIAGRQQAICYSGWWNLLLGLCKQISAKASHIGKRHMNCDKQAVV